MKAALESSHNLIHNRTADLIEFPGQTGANSRIDLPEQLHGRTAAMDLLQRAILALPAAVAEELRLPFVEAGRAIWAIERIQEEIARRTDHDLEGWEAAGLLTTEYHVNGMVLSAVQVASLDPAQRQVIEAVAEPRVRKLSPREVFDSGRGRLIRFRPEQAARMLVDLSGREVSVGPNHLITLEDRNISPDPLRFLAHTFAPGDKFRAVVNPYSPETAHLFDSGDRWVGAVKLWQAVSRVDQEAVRARISEASEIAAQLLQPLARRGVRQEARRLADLEHNNAVITRHQQAQSTLEDAADAAMANLY